MTERKLTVLLAGVAVASAVGYWASHGTPLPAALAAGLAPDADSHAGSEDAGAVPSGPDPGPGDPGPAGAGPAPASPMIAAASPAMPPPRPPASASRGRPNAACPACGRAFVTHAPERAHARCPWCDTKVVVRRARALHRLRDGLD